MAETTCGGSLCIFGSMLRLRFCSRYGSFSDNNLKKLWWSGPVHLKLSLSVPRLCTCTCTFLVIESIVFPISHSSRQDTAAVEMPERVLEFSLASILAGRGFARMWFIEAMESQAEQRP